MGYLVNPIVTQGLIPSSPPLSGATPFFAGLRYVLPPIRTSPTTPNKLIPPPSAVDDCVPPIHGCAHRRSVRVSKRRYEAYALSYSTRPPAACTSCRRNWQIEEHGVP